MVVSRRSCPPLTNPVASRLPPLPPSSATSGDPHSTNTTTPAAPQKMWSKISNALKRPETPAQDFDADDKPLGQTVLSTVFNHHPNLSNFHDPNEVPFPTPSPPASPSKNGRRGIFKRTAKTISENDQVPNLSIKLSIPHLKKVKSSLHGSTGESLFIPVAGV